MEHGLVNLLEQWVMIDKIALQAQSRKCRLNPPAFSAQAAVAGPSQTTSSATRVSPGPKKIRVTAAEPTTRLRAENETGVAQEKIKSLEAELARVKATKKARSKSPSSEAEPKPTVSTRRPKGASLANPHKKARKYEAVEFADDD
ncbi:hypothetical protein JVU11DRAFT_2224 [Chiua virens]|nr:hypothetical protein JVU11DRAFT_2224 [Chiua virens]